MSRQFDLEGFLESVPDSKNWPVRTAGVAMIVVSALVAALALWDYYLTPSGLPGGGHRLVPVLLVCTFFVVAGGLFSVIATPVPTSVEVDSNGIALVYPGGRVERYLWADRSLQLRFERTQGVIRRGLMGPPMVVLMGGRPPRRYLSVEAFDAIVQQALAHGLRVQDEPSPFPGFTRTVIRHG